MTAPTPVDTTPWEAPTVTKLHPIRGFFWGILAGIGLALVLIVTLVIELALVPILLCVVVMAVLGIVWGIVGPKKAPVGMAPVVVEPHPATPPATSRFDDFTDTPTPGPVAQSPQPDSGIDGGADIATDVTPPAGIPATDATADTGDAGNGDAPDVDDEHNSS